MNNHQGVWNHCGYLLLLEAKIRGLMPSEAKKIRQLEEENNQFKQLVAGLTLDKEMLQDVLSKK